MLIPCFLLLVLMAIIFLFLGTKRNNLIWLFFIPCSFLLYLLGSTDFLKNVSGFPPRIGMVFLFSLVYVILFFFQLKVEDLDLDWLVGVHFFRIPLEFILMELFLEKQIPEVMTLMGLNYDIVFGMWSGILILLLIFRKVENWHLMIWNIVGLLFLLIIVVISVLSLPTSFQKFGLDQPNTAILGSPYVLIPGILVPIFLLSHLLVFKILHKKAS